MSLALALHVGRGGLGSKRVGAKDIWQERTFGAWRLEQTSSRTGKSGTWYTIPFNRLSPPYTHRRRVQFSVQLLALDEVIYYFLVLYVCSTTFEKQPPWDGKLPFSLNFFSSSFPHPPTSAHTCAFTLRSFLPP